jgi:hypothetical protein
MKTPRIERAPVKTMKDWNHADTAFKEDHNALEDNILFGRFEACRGNNLAKRARDGRDYENGER